MVAAGAPYLAANDLEKTSSSTEPLIDPSYSQSRSVSRLRARRPGKHPWGAR
jgi:hypothetical protein